MQRLSELVQHDVRGWQHDTLQTSLRSGRPWPQAELGRTVIATARRALRVPAR